MIEMEPEDYNSLSSLLNHARQRAWQQQDTFIEGSGKHHTIHIQLNDEREAICCHGPHNTGNKSPAIRQTDAYQGVWREEREWCRYCITREYYGMDYRRMEGLLDE